MKTTLVTLTLSIIAHFANSQNNYSLYFDGINGEVSTPQWLTGTGNSFTYEAWIKPDSVQCNQCAYITHNAQDNDVVLEFLTNPLRLHGQIYLPGNFTQYNLYYPINPDAQTWYHTSLTYDGSYFKLFVNGIVVDSVAGNDNIDWNSNYSSSKFGSRDPSLFYKGNVDEIRIWNTARTNGQVFTYKDSCLQGNESGLVGYWRFEEGTGTSTADLTANSFNGTLVNGVLWDTAAPNICGLTTGLNHYTSNNGVIVYPNPMTEMSTLKFDNPTGSNCVVTLYDIYGRLVQSINHTGTDKIIIERQGLIDGIYFFQIRTDNHVIATGKLQIE